MASVDKWISVDRKGMRQMMSQRPKWFILTEPIQNAWDEQTTCLSVDFRHTGRNRCELVVTDDSPKGVQDLADLYTLFKPSYKKGNPRQRGWMNKGCKDVLAFVASGSIVTTTGSVIFLETGDRTTGRRKTKAGTQVSFILELSKADYEEACSVIPMLHVPAHITMTFNGQPVPHVKPIEKIAGVVLPTLLADDQGNMTRRTQRKTEIWVYDVPSGQEAHVYEMGIPVVATGDEYHYDIQQRVLLNSDRDNVTPGYLQSLRVFAFNSTHQQMTTSDQAQADWARAAASDGRCSGDAFCKSLDLRFGEDRVGADPSDKDAEGVAFSHGYAVVHGRNLSAGEWANAKRTRAVVPAGKVFPTYTGFVDCPPVPREEWTEAQRVVARYLQDMARALMSVGLSVRLIKAPSSVATVAKYVKGGDKDATLYLNVNHSELPDFECVLSADMSGAGEWYDIMEQWDDLMVHEFSHERAGGHWGAEVLDEATRLGAKLKRLVHQDPYPFGKGNVCRPFE